MTNLTGLCLIMGAMVVVFGVGLLVGYRRGKKEAGNDEYLMFV
ncbi:MAG: hypothetical protein PHH14_06430 [Candidatus Margulisbacteria bacterium]|nr:hypothetical protein [Candidatus Margulisiibacteriota bacterium]